MAKAGQEVPSRLGAAKNSAQTTIGAKVQKSQRISLCELQETGRHPKAMPSEHSLSKTCKPVRP